MKLRLQEQQIAITTSSDEPAPNEQRERVEAAKLDDLRQAASQGWADVAAGRCTDVDYVEFGWGGLMVNESAWQVATHDKFSECGNCVHHELPGAGLHQALVH